MIFTCIGAAMSFSISQIEIFRKTTICVCYRFERQCEQRRQHDPELQALKQLEEQLQRKQEAS